MCKIDQRTLGGPVTSVEEVYYAELLPLAVSEFVGCRFKPKVCTYFVPWTVRTLPVGDSYDSH